nr:hypothetical protein [Tanacetum cinerariifolium]
PEYVLEDVSHDNVRTHPPSCRFVVLSSGSADPASPLFVSPVTSAPTVVNAPVVRPAGDSRRSSGTGPKPGAFSTTSSQGSSADDFYESQTIDFAFALNVYKRDAEIADLKARLEKSEAEDAEVIELRKHLFDLEATVAIKVGELANFHTDNSGLVERVLALESERDSLKNQVEVEGKYVAVVFEFKGVSFLLLDELESLKDSPLALIMSALILKDDHGNRDAAPEKGLCSPLSSTLGEASGSAPPLDSSLGVTDYQVSTLAPVGDGGSADQASTALPNDDLFDTFVLDKPGDA